MVKDKYYKKIQQENIFRKVGQIVTVLSAALIVAGWFNMRKRKHENE